jgi:hypothetical protein
VWVKDFEGMPGISTVVVISQRPSSIFGTAKGNLTENKTNTAAKILIPHFIMGSFVPDPEL